jgi:hypothetical protein
MFRYVVYSLASLTASVSDGSKEKGGSNLLQRPHWEVINRTV